MSTELPEPSWLSSIPILFPNPAAQGKKYSWNKLLLEKFLKFKKNPQKTNSL
jgi:hypothetical protein